MFYKCSAGERFCCYKSLVTRWIVFGNYFLIFNCAIKLTYLLLMLKLQYLIHFIISGYMPIKYLYQSVNNINIPVYCVSRAGVFNGFVILFVYLCGIIVCICRGIFYVVFRLVGLNYIWMVFNLTIKGLDWTFPLIANIEIRFCGPLMQQYNST